MTSDATVGNAGAGYAGLGGYYGTLDMNCHTLTLKGTAGAIYEKFDTGTSDAHRGRQERLGDVVIV